ncbi:MAG TPA: ABC transporter permease [Polyangiaceae bacterium]|nr:ABC transporter permease [Polyangiaceae bacterium]
MTRYVVLEAGRSDREYFRDIWRYRELLYILAWRDISVRYRQTAIGIAWAAVRPLVATVVFSFVFGRMGKFPSGGVPYPVLVLAGLLPWQLFSSALTESGRSLVTNGNLITKVYFPRLIIPGSSLVASLIDFGISGLMLAGLMTFYGVVPGWQLVFLPLFIVLTMIATAGVGIWSAALAVKYRDFLVMVPFLLQLGLYLSPVGFSTAAVPDRWRLLYSLNPLVGAIDGFRWCLLGGKVPLQPVSIAASTALALAVLVTGIRYFRKAERQFADVI